MSAGIEFLLRLLDQDALPRLCAADLSGAHADLLRGCQEAGFVASRPDASAVPACVFCREGSPYRLDGVLRCKRCRSRLGPETQRTWSLDVAGFLGWLVVRLGLRGGVRRVEPRLWHLGVWGQGDRVTECFYQRPGSLSPGGLSRLEAYGSVVVLHGLNQPAVPARPGLRTLPLPRLLVWDEQKLSTRTLEDGADHERVRFDSASGVLWAAESRLGEVPVGSNECHFLACLAEHLDRYVAYGDLRREVLRRGGGHDSRDAATFCHEVKRRIKRNFIPNIDRVLATNNKGAGYRLRANPGSV